MTHNLTDAELANPVETLQKLTNKRAFWGTQWDQLRHSGESEAREIQCRLVVEELDAAIMFLRSVYKINK